MFENFKGLFSDSYNDYLKRKDLIRGVTLQAIDNIKGLTLYGSPVDERNPEEIIAALYLRYKDASMFRETV